MLIDGFNQNDIDKALKALADKETPDRVLAIVVVSYLEDYVARVIRSRMDGLDEKLKVKLFEGSGFLAPMAAKVDLALALDLIDKDMHADLVQLTRIRNRFAHNLHVDDFSDKDIAGMCGGLKSGREVVEATAKSAARKATSRERFEEAARCLTIGIYNYVHHRAMALITGNRPPARAKASSNHQVGVAQVIVP